MRYTEVALVGQVHLVQDQKDRLLTSQEDQGSRHMTLVHLLIIPESVFKDSPMFTLALLTYFSKLIQSIE